jgi:hypothetical protein
MTPAVDDRAEVTIGALYAEEARLRRIEEDWDPLAVEEGRW